MMKRKTFFVGIAGGSGAGKTTLADALHRAWGEERSVVIPHDAYYRDLSNLTLAKRAEQNFDAPEALETALLVSHLDRLAEGRAIDRPTYDFERHVRTDRRVTVEPVDVIVVEGILVLSESALCERFDLKVYVDAD